MCRDQNLISETDGRTDVRAYERTSVRAYERMKIEKPGVGRPLLGPAINPLLRSLRNLDSSWLLVFNFTVCVDIIHDLAEYNWFASGQPAVS